VRSTEKPAGPWPDSPAQRGKRPARPAATRAHRCGHHAQTVGGTTRWRARRWLDGGKVLPEILRGSQGMRWTRRRGQGHTGTAGRRRGGRRVPGRWHSPAGRELSGGCG
jgi:hypothetical protein